MAGDESKKQAARTFAIEAARAAWGARSRQVVVLDVSGLSPVTDYYVLSTGTSPRQMRSTADDIADLGKQTGFAPLSVNGQDSDSWVLVDCFDVVCHVFSASARSFYDLDNLWGDAHEVDWQTGWSGAKEVAAHEQASGSDDPADD